MSERRALGRAHLRALGGMVFDCFRLDHPPPVRGLDALAEHLSAVQGPRLVVSAHFGHWELLASGLSVRLPGEVLVLARRQPVPAVQALSCRIRERGGVRVAHRPGPGLREARRHLHAGGVLGLLGDPPISRGRTVQVELLGTQVAMSTGAARLALATGARVVVAGLPRTESYEVCWEDLGTEDDETAEGLTRRIAASLDRIIGHRRAQWLWLRAPLGLLAAGCAAVSPVQPLARIEAREATLMGEGDGWRGSVACRTVALDTAGTWSCGPFEGRVWWGGAPLQLEGAELQLGADEWFVRELEASGAGVELSAQSARIRATEDGLFLEGSPLRYGSETTGTLPLASIELGPDGLRAITRWTP